MKPEGVAGMYYLSAERMAVANQAVQDTFEQTSIAWQAIPHWDTGDPGQTRVPKDITYEPGGKPDPDGVERPFSGGSLEIKTETIRFAVTLAQATAPTPDALLAAVIARTVHLAREVDCMVINELSNELLKNPQTDIPSYGGVGGVSTLLNALIDARAKVEDSGYRAPSCLLTDTVGLKALSLLDPQTGISVIQQLDAAGVNSWYRVDKLEKPDDKDKGNKKPDEDKGKTAPTPPGPAPTPPGPAPTPPGPAPPPANHTGPVHEGDTGKMLLLGRRQPIAQGGAAAAFSGEEPVDLAVSVLPSLEVVGETTEGGNIELVVRIRYAIRIKDKNGVVAVVILPSDHVLPSERVVLVQPPSSTTPPRTEDQR